MALAGDPPTEPTAERGELVHAIELVELARAIGGFCIGVAAHPVGHPRAPSLAADRRHLARKLRHADFAVTQFFFEVADYLALVDDLEAKGLTKPVLPGILPVVSLPSIPRMAQMGCAVPSWLVERLQVADTRGGAEEVARVGVATATELCAQLLDKGVPGLHFYTLNRSEATRQIHANLGLSPG
jgi:methylenetetrahydrofolate reductase (NADPH)